METPSSQVTTKEVSRKHRGKMYAEAHIVFFKEGGRVQLTPESRAYRYKIEADRCAEKLNREHFDRAFGDFVVRSLEIKL